MRTTEAEKIAEKMRELNTPHTLTISGSNFTIVTQAGNKVNWSVNDLPKNNLFLIKMVRSYIEKNKPEIKKEIKRQDIKYISKYCNTPRRGKTYVEIDLNKAYWTKARELGYISDEIYERGLKPSIKKMSRLVSLGSLATKQYVYAWDTDKQEYIITPPKESELSDYFFSISQAVGEDIDFLFNAYKKYTLFYWVDAVIIEIEQMDNFISDAKSLGYEVKIKYVSEILKKENYISYFEADETGKKTKKNPKIFWFPRKHTLYLQSKI